jgi:uncharacterized repeat protein (TIGR03803 family)
MNTIGIRGYALSSCVAVAMLAGCGGSQPSIGAPEAMRQSVRIVDRMAPASAYEVLHRFGRGSDGSEPEAGLINVNGTLYGTTTLGGSSHEGTVFSITTTGKEKVLHSFGGRSQDGTEPAAALIDVNGTLYGTTSYGGMNDDGTVFSIMTTGTEKVLYSFGGASKDGKYPAAGLIDVNGMLYGMTGSGGSGCTKSSGSGCGTVFSITTRGAEKVLYRFRAGSDGYWPKARLISVKGTLYGTTTYGGGGCGRVGCGTVFSVTRTGTEQVLYSFRGGSADGVKPLAGLVDVDGTLYGTTFSGGANGYGTVISVTTTGREKLLYSFGSGSEDGEYPEAGLINVNGTLYGTTAYGGTSGDYGTVLSVTTTGTEKVLYSFGGGDGAYPLAGLINVNGTLYGTTYTGGSFSCFHHLGCGTVFALTP